MADRAGLENRCGSNATEGSNPSLSAVEGRGKRKPLSPFSLRLHRSADFVLDLC